MDADGADDAVERHERLRTRPAELPERTETLVAVQQSTRERAWYEAQRRRAVERLSDPDAPAGQARIQILAEIGRLGQAAVEPQLLDARAPRGTKLDLVVERVHELVEAGHQVLVFTPFMRVLGMLDGRLRKRGSVRSSFRARHLPVSGRDASRGSSRPLGQVPEAALVLHDDLQERILPRLTSGNVRGSRTACWRAD